ncbi:tetratricopeptide repeat protein [Ferruginibacter paludis]|uniref:tetratricopeptide repeat protein n=1 Tax=Ferruginibacter paludis TaxID=1310417 RepID=UPI0025B624E4|nr:tetratricopeptide repeat protein [Ferruginibacter paludis]MDN3657105.1 tetratricopeptide repeat protein [Ferruginibacter paludis]
MKRNILYTLLIAVCICCAGFIVIRYQHKQKKMEAMVYTLLPRKGLLAKTDEWLVTQKNVAVLQQKIKANAADTKSTIALANYFILEARATGNYPYYDMAAMKLVNNVLKTDAANFEALTLKSVIYLSQHHFADGLATAEHAGSIIPYNAFVQGILVDGHVEMGNYDSALECAQKMMDIRPDLRSYARASYLREIFGDYPGAIDAMKLAIDAGAPGDEATEWSRIQLGHLYENTGDLKAAEMSYQQALAERPGYMYALAGMARIATASKDYNKAIDYYQQAAKDATSNSFMQELANVYYLAGQKENGTAVTKKLVEDLDKNANAANSDESIGHYADKELAYAYLSAGNKEKALEHALMEYNRRPKNIDVNETLAWMYFENNEPGKALPYLREAMKTNSKNPTLLCRAGLIFAKNGDTVKANKYLQDAVQNNPNIDETLKTAALQQIKSFVSFSK